jgi:hypothetical protein
MKQETYSTHAVYSKHYYTLTEVSLDSVSIFRAPEI